MTRQQVNKACPRNSFPLSSFPLTRLPCTHLDARTRKNAKYEDTVGGANNDGTPFLLCATGCSCSPIRTPCLRAGRVALQSAGVVGAMDQEGGDADVGVHSTKGELEGQK